MAYDEISEPETDPFAPAKSSLFKRLVGNLLGAFAGDPGAPRLTQTAVMNPTAGTFRTITNVSGTTLPLTPGSSKSQGLFQFSFITPGTVRIRTIITSVSNPGNSPATALNVQRIRNGSGTMLASYDTVGTRNDDFNFQIGDKLSIGLSAFDGQSISGSAAILIGNDAITGVVL